MACRLLTQRRDPCCGQRHAHAFRACQGSAPRRRTSAHRARRARVPAAQAGAITGGRGSSSRGSRRGRARSARRSVAAAAAARHRTRDASRAARDSQAARSLRSFCRAMRRCFAPKRLPRCSIRTVAAKPPPRFSQLNSPIPPATAASCATPKAACWRSSRKKAPRRSSAPFAKSIPASIALRSKNCGRASRAASE